MANFKNLINQVLYEKKSDSQLKVFYQADIFIQSFPGTEQDTEQQAQQQDQEQQQQGGEGAEAEGGEEAAAESSQESSSLLTEDIFQTKVDGTLNVPDDDAKNILTLNDLLEYIGDKKIEEQPLINDLVIEVVMALTGDQSKRAVNEIVGKGDRINITLDYGFTEDDSIGLQVNKNPGVEMATIVMRRDGKPLTGSFSVSLFNQQITNVFLNEL